VIDEVVAEATARWPQASWTAARLAKYLDPLDDAVALTGQHRGDLLLAWACLEQEAVPLAEFEAGPIADARAHLGKLGYSQPAIDEAVQHGLAKLVIDGALASYRGRGPLSMFVRTSIVRLAIDHHRSARSHVELSELIAAPSIDPELEYMRKLYGEELRGAARDAWVRLAPHERYILSLRVVDGLPMSELARVYGIHAASATRRVASARASLITHTRTCLRERLSVGEATLDSILRIVTTSVQLGDSDGEAGR
jgi:RNA polymerase sigma-70 factor